MSEPTRTDAITAAIAAQLKFRRSMLDASDDLGQVTITVKMAAGTNWVRGVVWEEERVCRGGAPLRRREDATGK